MSNILITCFNSRHDLISTANLIAAIKTENPNSKIEIITNKEFYDLAGIISGVQRIHTIDTEIISNIYANPLYSDAFALNQFSEDIKEVSSKNWDKIINYSNDNISSYLISALNTEEVIGSQISNKGAVHCTNDWSIYQNFVASSQGRHPIDKITIRNKMIGAPAHNDYIKIKTDESYSVVAAQNFKRIREMKGSPGTFVVGLNLENGVDGQEIDIDTYIDIIEAMEDSSDYKAVLLLNGKNYQRSIANELNQRFNNTLISINIDTVALPSVISNLDAVVSTANATLAISDLMETKCIEIRNSKEERTPITIGENNNVIYATDQRALSSDILLVLNEEFGTELPIERMSSDNPIYQVVLENDCHFYSQIRGKLDIQKELRYHITRAFFFELFGEDRNKELLEHIKNNTDEEHLTEFSARLKAELTSAVKLLLGTLRSLKGVKNSESNLNSFITSLDNLIQVGKSSNLTGDIVRLFEGKIENIQTNDIDANIKAIEDHLFELKGELQVLTSYLGDLVGTTRDIQRAPAKEASL